MVTSKAYKFRFYPTEEQKDLLSQTFGCVRVVYNKALRMRTDAWYKESKRINYSATSSYLTSLKKEEEYQWLNDVSCVPLQQSLRHLQTAFTNFFEKRASYPTFKKKTGKQSAEFTKSAFKWDGDNQRLFLGKGIGKLKVRWSRKLSANPTTITISKDCAERYFVSLRIEEDVQPLPQTEKSVGLDMGLTHTVITSDGLKVGNPKFLHKNLNRLALLQRRLSKKQKGSQNREKARKRVAKLQVKIADSRKDFLNKLSTQLIRNNQAIFVEDLNIRGMIKNRHLSKSIADVSWSELIRQLEYKAEWYGRELWKINRFFPSSKRCNHCGHVVDSLSLSIRSWCCPECSTQLDRDINAAKNILEAGLALSVCGEGVRPPRSSERRGHSSMKQKPPKHL